MEKILKIMVTTILSSMLLFVNAQTQIDPLPIDSAVRYGQLENGLTYYIRHNEQPKQRCEFHIAQAVGAILEEDSQNGLAHFLEHMAFNGTEHYEGKGIINYFESIGVNFGGNINAYTALDETVYRLSDVPTIREGIVDSALLVLRDWSCGLLLTDEEIDSERGVIREEWRTRSNASRRLWTESNRRKYPNSQYAIRDVIGDTAVINNFDYSVLRDYYKKWYGPDLQAIVVVGDIDVDKMEAKIKALFAPIAPRVNRGERPIYPIADNVEPIVAIVTDKEATNTRIELEYKHEKMPDAYKISMVGAVSDWMHVLIAKVLGYRFDEMIQKPDAPFVYATGWYGELMKSKDAFQMLQIPKEGEEKAALKALFVETEKLKRFGITASELERAKTEMLAEYEKRFNERDTRKNHTLTREYIRHYLDKEVIPGIEWEYNTLKMLLPQINLQMANDVAKSYVKDENLIVGITAPEKETVVLPTEAEVLAMIAEVKAMEIEAPKEENFDQPLVAKTPKAGKIKKASKNAALGTTEWTLSNGVKVVIKPTEFKQDEILLRAHSIGGLSQVANAEDLPSAMVATSIMQQNGLGEFSSIQLQKLLTGKVVSVSPDIEDESESIHGNSSVKDFETMLQLVYLGFTAPRKDDDAFKSLMGMFRTSLANKENNPKSIFSDSIQTTLGSHHERVILFSSELVDKVDQDKALQIFKERFANPADFTFFFTGKIDPEDAATQKMICTWLGSLKTKKIGENYVDRGVHTPKGEVKNYFTRKMLVHTATNRIVYSGKMDYTLKNRVNMRALGNILDIRYLESIREREGGSYGVGVAGYTSQYPEPQAFLLMQFDTDPAKQEKLMSVIHEEVKEILKNGPRADDLTKVKESFLKDLAENMEENSYWQNTILYRYYIEGVDYLKDYKAAVENITAESIQQTLKALTDQNNVVEVVMMPEE